MTTTLEIGTKISRIMNLGFFTAPEDVILFFFFLKKEHFVPSVQREDFASGVDNLVTSLSRPFFTRFKQHELFSTFLLLDGGSGQILFS